MHSFILVVKTQKNFNGIPEDLSKDSYCIATLRIISTSPATPPWTIFTPVCACWALLDWAICLSVHQSVSVSEVHSQSLILWAVRASQSTMRVDFPLKVMETQCFSAWLMAKKLVVAKQEKHSMLRGFGLPVTGIMHTMNIFCKQRIVSAVLVWSETTFIFTSCCFSWNDDPVYSSTK